MTIYLLSRGPGGPAVTIQWEGDHFKCQADLLPAASRAVHDFSPGFDWGDQAGAGIAQLALAILLHQTQNPWLAVQLANAFRWEFLTPIPYLGGQLYGAAIENWLQTRETSVTSQP